MRALFRVRGVRSVHENSSRNGELLPVSLANKLQYKLTG